MVLSSSGRCCVKGQGSGALGFVYLSAGAGEKGPFVMSALCVCVCVFVPSCAWCWWNPARAELVWLHCVKAHVEHCPSGRDADWYGTLKQTCKCRPVSCFCNKCRCRAIHTQDGLMNDYVLPNKLMPSEHQAALCTRSQKRDFIVRNTHEAR